MSVPYKSGVPLNSYCLYNFTFNTWQPRFAATLPRPEGKRGADDEHGLIDDVLGGGHGLPDHGLQPQAAPLRRRRRRHRPRAERRRRPGEGAAAPGGSCGSGGRRAAARGAADDHVQAHRR